MLSTHLTQEHEWLFLKQYQRTIANKTLSTWFKENNRRFEHFSAHTDELFLDYSKNRFDETVKAGLTQLARTRGLSYKIEALFTGQAINFTERQPALHTALRDPSHEAFYVNGNNIKLEIENSLQQMAKLVERIQQGKWLGFTGKPITTIVNIGIGGSHLGPAMVLNALRNNMQSTMNCYFLANIDADASDDLFKKLNPEQTLFIISSKSFTTQETLINADAARHWLVNAGVTPQQLANHFVAVTSQTDKARRWGIAPDQILKIWSWVGGRYSVWSAISLPVAIIIGMPAYRDFLAGAHAIDQHYLTTTFENNLPVILAILQIWYTNFFASQTYAILPYSERLTLLPRYIQQLAMESNGKSVDANGARLNYASAPIMWGESGCNGQHAFHQLLYQGTQLIPADFIIPLSCHSEHFDSQHQLMVLNAISQTQALMQGKPLSTVTAELQQQGLTETEIAAIAPHKVIAGNQPTNSILLDKITPRSLGALLALYEHKTYSEAAILNINPFDQWGVELGKQLASQLLQQINQENLDSSTQGLLTKYFVTTNREISNEPA